MNVARVTRRAFLAASGSCAAHLALTIGAGPYQTRRLFAAVPVGPVVWREPWGRLEKLAEPAHVLGGP